MLELQKTDKTVHLQSASFEVGLDVFIERVTSMKKGLKETCDGSILERIQTPFDLRQLRIDQLRSLAAEIRQLILDTVSRTGGHLASNLGTIEGENSDRWPVLHQEDLFRHRVLSFELPGSHYHLQLWRQ